MDQTIRDLMSEDVVTVSPQQSVQEAARLMEDNNIGAIPVVENGQVQGIITDRDITLRSTADGDHTATVEECMSRHLTMADPSMDVHEAAKVMAHHQIRRLPVVENGQLVGMLSIGDLAREEIYDDEAGEALQDISMPDRNQQ
ncbi:CBS domain-containing protein [Bacillaceae bacterium W0354]